MNVKNFAIIGGTGGIGSLLAESLRAAGASVVIIGRRTLKDLAMDERSSAHYIQADMANCDLAKAAFEEANKLLGSFDGVVNLAGSILLKPAHLTTDEEFDAIYNQNVKTAFNTIKYAYPFISKSCSIVLMSSVAGSIGLQNHEAISAAKAAIIGLTKSAAATYSSKGLRVNCIAPGLVETNLSERITSNPAALKGSLSLHPLKRIGLPGDIVPFIQLLLSDSSSWVTGQTFGVDGGLASIKNIT